MADEQDVRRLALELPATVERPSYGTPGFRVKDKLFARLHEEPGVLVLWCESAHDKQALMAQRPEAFFSPPHYEGHDLVLVRLERVSLEELSELLADAWRLRAPARLVAELDGGLPSDLGAPATRTLVAAGYGDLAALDGVPRSTVAALHGMGPSALRRLEEALAARGLALA